MIRARQSEGPMGDGRIHGVLSGSTWSGAIFGLLGTLSFQEWMTIGGFILAAAGFAVNWWHKRKIVRIAELELRLKAGGKIEL